MKLWKKLEVVENPPIYLRRQDECYYARDYISHGGYQASEANQLISNYKKHPRFRQHAAWRYRVAAVAQFAQELASILPPNSSVAVMPSSKVPGHPDFDGRVADLERQLRSIRRDLRVEQAFSFLTSMEAAHQGGSREIEEIVANLAWHGIAPCERIFIVDDVLTTGAHFRACKRVLAREVGRVDAVGVFWARTVWRDV